MTQTISCAIDSLPLSKDMQSCFDYSGLQIHGLTNTPLNQHLNPSHIVADERSLEISLNEMRWNTGNLIKPEDYIRGIQSVLKSNPFIDKFLFRKVKAISTRANALKFKFHKSNHVFHETLSLPNFSPIANDSNAKSSGKYQMTFQSSNQYDFSSNPFHDSAANKLSVKVIKSPQKNITSFLNGSIDISADTAFPFDRLADFSQRSCFRMRDTGLRAKIVFGPKLNTTSHLTTRQSLAWAIKQISFDGITNGICEHTEGYAFEPTLHKENEPLKLAYDPFYPNKEICESIATTLNAIGWDIKLVEDDYYKPHQNYDLKFTIQQEFLHKPYLNLANQLFSGVMQNDKAAQQKLAIALDQIENTANESNRTKLATATHETLKQHVVTIPLFKIPSLSLQRNTESNPLLSQWECQ